MLTEGIDTSFAGLCIMAAVGILKNRLWGLWLALISTVLTLCAMPLFLPFGTLDGVIAALLLVLLLVGHPRCKALVNYFLMRDGVYRKSDLSVPAGRESRAYFVQVLK